MVQIRSRRERTLAIIGFGPAGRALATRAQAGGWHVSAWDPTGGRCPSSMGMWRRQFPTWLPHDMILTTHRPWVIFDDYERQLSDEYIMLSPTAFMTATDIKHLHPERASVQSIRQQWLQLSENVVGSTADRPVWIFDTSPTTPLPIRQLALGVIVDEAALPPSERRAVLMDYRVPTRADIALHRLPLSAIPWPDAIADPPAQPADPQDAPWASFSYRMPLGDGRWLIEETVVATYCQRPYDSKQWSWLRQAQLARLQALGISRDDIHDWEFVDFPLGPREFPQLRRGDRHVVQWGARAGMIHAATGYSIGTAFELADDILAACEPLPKRSRIRGPLLAVRWWARRNAPPRGWVTAWLHRRGLRAMLEFSPAQVRDFFGVFFTLPPHQQREYLTGTHSSRVFGVMAQLLIRLLRSRRDLARTLVRGVFQPLIPPRLRGDKS